MSVFLPESAVFFVTPRMALASSGVAGSSVSSLAMRTVRSTSCALLPAGSPLR